MKFLAEPQQQAWWASRTGFVPVGHKALALLNESGFYEQQPEQRTALSQMLNTRPGVNSQGIRLGNFPQIREVIEGELVDVVEGRKSVEAGLDAAKLTGNALLRVFRVINGAAGQGEI